MKKFQLTLAFIVIAFIAFSGWGNAQTLRTMVNWSAEGATDPCTGRPISGDVTYQISYHLNPTTGAVENVHWIILHSNVWDKQTGDKYVVMEIGHDNLGYYWSGWDDMAGNVMPTPFDYPGEGVMIEAHLKWVGKGGYKFTITERLIVHKNAAGDVTVSKYSSSAECK